MGNLLSVERYLQMFSASSSDNNVVTDLGNVLVMLNFVLAHIVPFTAQKAQSQDLRIGGAK